MSAIDPLQTLVHVALVDRMSSRLSGIVATLWFFFAIFSVFVALVLSPMGLRLLLPDAEPASWFYPTFLLLPPILLVAQGHFDSKLTRATLWLMSIGLTVLVLALVALLGRVFFAF